MQKKTLRKSHTLTSKSNYNTKSVNLRKTSTKALNFDKFAEITQQGKNYVKNPNDLNNFFLPFQIPIHKKLTRKQKIKEDFVHFKYKCHYSIISSNVTNKNFVQSQRVFTDVNDNEKKHYTHLNSLISESASKTDSNRWNDLLKDLMIPHRVLHFDKEQQRDKNYCLKVFEHQFNNEKFDSSLVMFFGNAVQNGNFLLENESQNFEISCQEILNLWTKRKSQQKHLLIILDCNYSEKWIEYLKQNLDTSVSIQASCKANQKSKVSKFGGFLSHNLLKLIEKRSQETVLIPEHQQICFQGSLLQVKKYINLIIYFKKWETLEQNLKWFYYCYEGEECFYKGQIWNGTRNGWGYQEWIKGDLKGAWYNGQFKNGKFSGIGILCKPNGEIIEGQFKNNRVSGWAVEYAENIYEGEWVKNIKKGKGKLIMKEGIYEGEFDQNKPQGKGEVKLENGTYYLGDFFNGMCQGKGTIRYKNGDIYEGNWKNSEKNGKGVYKFANGDIFDGNFLNGVKHGEGKFQEFQGEQYKGEYVDGKLNGEAVYILKNGETQGGEWKNGEQKNKMIFFDSKSQRIKF